MSTRMFSLRDNVVYRERRSRTWMAIRVTTKALSSASYPNEHLLINSGG